MKNSHLLQGTLPLLAFALNAAASSAQPDGVLSFPVKASARSLNKRQQDVGVDARMDGALYTIDITIGTPGQTVSLELATSAAETWVNPVCSQSSNPSVCSALPRFSTSSSWTDLNTVTGVQSYPAGYVEWNYGYDVFRFGSAVVEQQIFGAAYDSRIHVAGQLGLGPNLQGWDSAYPFVLDSMFYQGIINSRVFSLDLGGVDGDDGAITFGGIDTHRYTGNLHTLSIVSAGSSPDGYTRFWVRLNGMVVSREGTEAVPVLDGSTIFDINSAAPFSAFPYNLFNAILEQFPEAAPIPGSNGYSVPCSVADEDGFVSFRFAGTTITVPMRDFILRQPQGSCSLGIQQSDSYPVLGQNFLRGAYVVFDWDNRRVHVAPSAPANCGSNLVAVGSGPGAVPWIAGDCDVSPSSSASASVSSSASLSASSASDISSTITSDSASSSITSSADISSSDVSSQSSVDSSTQSSSDEVSSTSFSSSDISSSTILSSDISASSSVASSSSDVISSSTEQSSSIASSTESSEIISSSTEQSSSVASSTDSSSASSSSEASSSISESLSSSTASATSDITSASESSSASASSSDISSAVSSEYSSEPCESETSGEISSSTFASETTTVDYSPPSITSIPYGTITRPPLETSTVTATTTYTITSCGYDVPSCTVGEITTAIITQYTTFCPQTTATYTLPGYTCGLETCPSGPAKEPHVVTVYPAPSHSVPVEIPGCYEGITKSLYTTAPYGNKPSVVTSITPSNATYTVPVEVPVETAGAPVHGASAVLALGAGILAALLA